MKCNVGDYVEALGDRWYPCCSGWIDVFAEHCSLEEALKSQEFQEFKESVEDGSYRHCLGTCPTIVQAQNEGDWSKQPGRCNYTATKVNVGIDGSCLLACKACRGGQKYTEPYDLVQTRLQRLTDGMKTRTESVTFSSCGDPIFSRSIREWLQNFKKEDYPKLRNIELRTNAQLFTEKFWNSLGDAKDLIKSLWISVDAATKETYESLRIFGSWERLWKNLNFIGTINSIKSVQFSFVVQRGNVSEIYDYYKVMSEWGKKYDKFISFYFQQAGHWPGVSQKMFDEEINIFNDPKLWKEATDQLNKCRAMTDVPNFYLSYQGSVQSQANRLV